MNIEVLKGSPIANTLKEQIRAIVIEENNKSLARLIKYFESKNKGFKDATYLSKKHGIPRSTIYDKCRKQEIPFHRMGGKILFDEDEVEAWIKAGRPKIIDEALRNLNIIPNELMGQLEGQQINL